MATGQELLDKLGRKRERILLLLYREGEVKTSDIRDECEIPRGSKEYHFGILEEDHELIERVGTVPGGGGIPERVWSLTDAGAEFVEEWLAEDSDRPEDHELRLERLENKVDRQDREIDGVRDDVADEIREKVNEWFNDIQGDLKEAKKAAESAADDSDIETVISGLESLEGTIDGVQEDLEATADDVDAMSDTLAEVEHARARDQRELRERIAEIEERLDEAEEKREAGVFSRL